MTIRVSIPSQYPLLVAGLENCLKNSSEIKIVGTSNLNIHFEFNSQKVDILIIGQDSLQTIQSKSLLNLKNILMCDQKVLDKLN